ncbi:DUF2309 domain-containing protein [Nonlabens antarcticus]|uniref:DUF2309 domain-containing protein n=1 Tax=Nonlabens antarcticus TaxID=392714 RepID=UPI00189157EA|nr:DUF2309 domain-containing protein [Nonlabens antarcticus]
MINQSFLNSIEQASNVVGKTWPLYSFVTSNPLVGYENMHFAEAIKSVEQLLGATTLPSASAFRQAFEQGEIDQDIIYKLLVEGGFNETIEFYINQLNSEVTTKAFNENHKLDRIMVKWLSAFMDEGLAEWEMPHKEEGFFKSWRSLAIYDNEIGFKSLGAIPKTSSSALQEVLGKHSAEERQRIFEYHLGALPGWTGYIKFREKDNTLWQQAYRITLEEYLAVRLTVADVIKAQILPEKQALTGENPIRNLQHIFLKAWEKTWQASMLTKLKQQGIDAGSKNAVDKYDAQLVFCIDTRSELIRRHVEKVGNYETFGYAGFFGIAMDYTNFEDGLSRKSCPPIVGSAYQVSESVLKGKTGEVEKVIKRNERKTFVNYFLTRMKNMLPSAFGYVEGAGVFYGFSLLSRTLLPAKTYSPERRNQLDYENVCSPEMNSTSTDINHSSIPLEEKIGIVKSAFDLTGWTQFSPLVLFVGHGSHSANNPFGSSLDCGACAASPGRHNARMLAKLANLPEVRNALRNRYQLDIPADTIFIGAEHNTTTDEIVIFDSEVPDSHATKLDALIQNLKKVQEMATQERLGTRSSGVPAAHKKTNNWAETRPEWGLAKNAGFIVGPRSLTKQINLEGNCFLQSYNWELDTEGKALEGIMQGPMVVTQWINNHYYFATVDNEKFGGGSKITHNVTGRFGVVQGNGGDLKIGLPLQSVNSSDDRLYHKPLRLSVMIQAPKDRIQDILVRNENLKSLLDNEWIYLLVMDPTQENEVVIYKKGLNWINTLSKSDTMETINS